VVGSTIKAGGNVELFLPGIWEMAFTGNDAPQLARNFSVMRAAIWRRGLLPVVHSQRDRQQRVIHTPIIPTDPDPMPPI
jgi:hypothetical protein